MTMNFVGLLSGGKDSCYNIVECIKHGHNLICLGNLTPPSGFIGEELNSFMYQSAGHGVIPLLAECFDKPLIRQHITGGARNIALRYDIAEMNDEVEDLYDLLSKVKTEFPVVNAVSCGTIVSTYQRLRVENVCWRLGLTPLTYLWQRDRAALLDDITASGMEAVLVKVAGAGLDPIKHLGKTLNYLKPTLTRLHLSYGLDVCGEGGRRRIFRIVVMYLVDYICIFIFLLCR
jgi:diphthine-ammonia ligase